MTAHRPLVPLAPLCLLAVNLWTFLTLCAAPSILTAALLVFTLYGLAPIALRLHELFHPLNEGVSRLDDKTSLSWRFAHHLQAFYEAFPALEAVLRLTPGAYSLWLRLWGARIGFGVQWPARIRIADRSLLEIGNRVSFGADAVISPHLMQRRGGETVVLVRRVTVGDRAQIAEGVRLGPGARVLKDAITPVRTEVGINQTFGGETRHPNQEEAQIAAETAGG